MEKQTPTENFPVKEWPAYLLDHIPDDVREALVAEAERRDLSLDDTIRQILCEHYGLECEPRASKFREPSTPFTKKFVRLQPELFAAIVADVRTRRSIILDILTEHLKEDLHD
jgi:predicted HicB family RNase H-like nuclease